MRRLPTDLFLLNATAILAVAFSPFTGGWMALRAALGLAMVIWLPGYAITIAAFPKQAFGMPERITLAVGLSIATAVLSGLALHLTPWGLQATAWTVFLAGITLAASLIGWFRRRQETPGAEDPGPAYPSLSQVLFLALAVVVAGLAILLARTPTASDGFEGYTELWIQPAGEAHPEILLLGVSSHEFGEMDYRLRVEANGQVIQEWPAFKLKPGETFETVVEVPENQKGPVEANLIRIVKPNQVYRQVILWPEGQTE